MSIRDDLRRRLRHFGLEKAYDASVVCAAAKEIAEGEFEPVSFRSGTLKIQVDSAGRGHILKIRQKDLILKINGRLGAEQVKRIMVVVRE